MQFLKILKSFYMVVTFLCIALFIVVYYSEFIQGQDMCSLCVYERFPYLLILYFLSKICFGYFFMNAAFSKKVIFSFLSDMLKYNIFIICCVFISLILALTHIALEKGWTNTSFLCIKEPTVNVNAISKTDYINSSLSKKFVDCKMSGVKFFDFSLANLNLFFGTFLMTCFVLINFLVYKRCFSQESFYKSLNLKSEFEFSV